MGGERAINAAARAVYNASVPSARNRCFHREHHRGPLFGHLCCFQPFPPRSSPLLALVDRRRRPRATLVPRSYFNRNRASRRSAPSSLSRAVRREWRIGNQISRCLLFRLLRFFARGTSTLAVVASDTSIARGHGPPR